MLAIHYHKKQEQIEAYNYICHCMFADRNSDSMIVYLTEQGASLTKKGKRLVLKKQGNVLRYIHTHNLEQIILMGSIMLSPSTVHFVLSNNIDTVYMTVHGDYRGRLTSALSKNIELRIKQFKHCDNKEFAMTIAKECVRGKLENYRSLLRRLNQELKIEEMESAIHNIRNTLGKLDNAATIDAVRGHEGYGSAEYFSAFKYGIKNNEFQFTTRVRRPPTDPINALLSFGYTLLLNTMITHIYIAGLDPYLGNLHEVDYGRPSLALDLIEEFRPVIVDSLILKLINKRCLSPHDFVIKPVEGESTADTKYPVLLTKTALRKFIHYFEDKLAEKYFYFHSGQKLTYKQIMEKQVRQYAHALEGAGYKSLLWS